MPKTLEFIFDDDIELFDEEDNEPCGLEIGKEGHSYKSKHFISPRSNTLYTFTRIHTNGKLTFAGQSRKGVDPVPEDNGKYIKIRAVLLAEKNKEKVDGWIKANQGAPDETIEKMFEKCERSAHRGTSGFVLFYKLDEEDNPRSGLYTSSVEMISDEDHYRISHPDAKDPRTADTDIYKDPNQIVNGPKPPDPTGIAPPPKRKRAERLPDKEQ